MNLIVNGIQPNDVTAGAGIRGNVDPLAFQTLMPWGENSDSDFPAPAGRPHGP